jgi:hypothetical protein
MSDTYFSGHTSINMGSGGVGMVEYGGGVAGQVANFYLYPVPDPIASAAQGIPIKKNLVYIQVAPPGERLNIIRRPATSQDRQIWAHQYAQFEKNQEQQAPGTPIELLYPENPALAQTLRANGVQTVQQLAKLSANAIETLGMGAQDYVNAAQAYIKAGADGAGAIQIRKELEGLQREKNVLERKVAECMDEIGRLKVIATNGGGSNSAGLTIEQVQAMIAASQGRPELPPAGGLGQSRVAPRFDSATAQINATHPTKIVSEAGKGKRKRETL